MGTEHGLSEAYRALPNSSYLTAPPAKIIAPSTHYNTLGGRHAVVFRSAPLGITLPPLERMNMNMNTGLNNFGECRSEQFFLKMN